jgi:hypothetical protein
MKLIALFALALAAGAQEKPKVVESTPAVWYAGSGAVISGLELDPRGNHWSYSRKSKQFYAAATGETFDIQQGETICNMTTEKCVYFAGGDNRDGFFKSDFRSISLKLYMALREIF